MKAEAKARQQEGGKTKLRQKIAEAPDTGKATQRAAEMFGTNRTYVAQAAKIKEEDPEKFDAVKRGVVGISDYAKSKIARAKFNELRRGRGKLVVRMKNLGLDESDQLRIMKWADLKDEFGRGPVEERKAKWADRALDLHDEGAPLNKALRQAGKEYESEKEARREGVRRQAVEEKDREFQEREPFEHFAEFLLGNAPGLSLCWSAKDYDLTVRHMKNCKLTKLVAAVEKMKAEWDAEEAA